MSALKFRFVSVLVLVLAACAVSQSAGARVESGAPSIAGAVDRYSAHARRGDLRGSPQRARAFSQAPAHLLAPSGNPAFAKTGASFGDMRVTQASWADYDADGRLDILASGCADLFCMTGLNTLYRNTGNGAYSENANAGLPALVNGSSAWADYNLDGKVDVVLSGCTDWTCETGGAKLFRNNGDGTFSEEPRARITPVGVFFGNGSPWVDYDNDGRPDLSITGYDSVTGDSVNKLYHNNADGSFSENTRARFGNVFDALDSWSDYDSDGYPDVLVVGCGDIMCSTYVSRLFRNNSDGTFTENTRAGIGGVGTWAGIAWADYDGDGLQDVVLSGDDLASGAPVTKLYRNNGGGSFTENTSSGISALDDAQDIWGDYDSDGRIDLLINGSDASRTYVTEIFHNIGDGTFSRETNTGLPPGFAWLGWGHDDSDGRLDLLVWSTADVNIGVFRNRTPAPAALAAPPSGQRARLTATQEVTFYWDASSFETQGRTVTYNLKVETKRGASDVRRPQTTANGSLLVPQQSGNGGRTSATVKLPRPGVYYWSVQSVGANFRGSPFTREQRILLPPTITVKRPGKINACGPSPLSATVRGTIGPLFSPGAVVTLQRRASLRSGWRTLARTNTNEVGSYSFAGIGRGRKTSFWVRTMSVPQLGVRLVSGSRRVIVKRASACD